MVLRRRSDKVDALGRVPLFRGLSQRELSVVAKSADDVSADEGKVLARQDGLGREFLLILEGRARVERDGRTIARLRAGDFFGEMSLIDGKPRSATVVAETPLALLVIEGRAFGGLLQSTPGLQRKIMVGLCERLREADAKLAKVN